MSLMKEMSALVCAVACWLGVCLSCGCWAKETPFQEPSTIPFDAEIWRAESWKSESTWPTNRYTQRRRMIGDLLENHSFAGMHSNEVVELLGEPLVDLRPYGLAKWDIGYYVGVERMGKYSLDSEFLVFLFDSTGRVLSCRTVVH